MTSDLALARMVWDGGNLDIVAIRKKLMKRSDIIELNPDLTIDDFPGIGTFVRFEYYNTDGMREC